MQWSKLRSAIRSLVCPELGRRIDFHVTSYRHSHDEAEKAWITIDGNRVLTASWYQHQWHRWPRDAKGRIRWDADFPPAVDYEPDEIHLPQDVGDALRCYLDLPIHEALKSNDPVIRALSLVDRRVGKRTLLEMQITDRDHSLVRAFYQLRLSAMQSSKSIPGASRTSLNIERGE